MQRRPVLMVTQNPALWSSWQELSRFQWQPHRGVHVDDLQPWAARNHSFVVLDLALPGRPGLEDTIWHTYFKGLKVLGLSAHVNDSEGQLLLSRGASGYAHSHSSVQMLSHILHSIEDGAIWMGRSLLQKLLHDIDQRLPSTPAGAWESSLSQREIEVARQAAMGHSNAEIAHALRITERTVRAHLSAVFEKLQVHDRLQLALKVHGIRA